MKPTIYDMTKVMASYKQGKRIESKKKFETEWTEDTNPTWDWNNYDYQIRPQTVERPYKNAQEFMVAKDKEGCELITLAFPYSPRLTIIWCDNRGVIIPDAIDGFKHIFVPYDKLMVDYAWAKNGTLCGVKEDKDVLEGKVDREVIKGAETVIDDRTCADVDNMYTKEGITLNQISVMAAYAQGCPIECRKLHDGDWESIENPAWNWVDYIYRIADKVQNNNN